MSADTSLLVSEFHRRYGRKPAVVSVAPGRVNLIGEHTDYNEGFVLPAAIDRTISVAASPRGDLTVRVHSLDYNQCDEFPVDRVRRFMGSRGWRDYVRGVVWALQDANFDLCGADLLVTGDVPRGAGLSSSAAIELAVAGALTKIAGIDVDRRRLALICQKAENLFAGVQCGIMDQYASALGEEGAALLIDCRSLETKPVPLPLGVGIVVVDSKVPRRLADTPYNERRSECAAVAAALDVEHLRYAEEHRLEAARSHLPDYLYRRARHVISENRRVLAAVDAFKSSDLPTVGRLMTESHASLRDDFEVSTPELDILVEAALGINGLIGARLTGAGFGGCTVNLVLEDEVTHFSQRVRTLYKARTGLNAEVHVLHAVAGLVVTHV